MADFARVLPTISLFPLSPKQAGSVNEVCSAQFIHSLIQHDSPDKSKPFGGLF